VEVELNYTTARMPGPLYISQYTLVCTVQGTVGYESPDLLVDYSEAGGNVRQVSVLTLAHPR